MARARLESAEATVADPRWFPLEFDVARDELHFALISAEAHRSLPFLKGLIRDRVETRVLPLEAVRAERLETAKMQLILHSSLGGSTLLARAIGQPGIALPLQEPPVLTDVIAYGLKNPPDATRELLGDIVRLLARPFIKNEVIVCKVSGIGNGLSIPITEMHAQSRILCLDTALEEMLSSYASRGAEGRRAARKLLIGLKNSNMLATALSEQEVAELVDLQCAALSWLSMRKAMLDAAARFGPKRVGAISSRQLMDDPRDALSAAAGHLALDLDVQERLGSGIFERHAKTGGPFSAAERGERIAETLRVHRDEIEPVVAWTRKIAEASAVAWDLPYPLRGRS